MSIEFLGRYAGATKIDRTLDDELREKWQRSDLWPVTMEQETWVSGPEGNANAFTNFCPETLFNRFGWFASGLYEYASGIDADWARSKLHGEGIDVEDWRWRWASMNPMHFTECPLYSPLNLDQTTKVGIFGSVGVTETRLDRWISHLKNNPFIATLILVFFILSAMGLWTSTLGVARDEILKLLHRI